MSNIPPVCIKSKCRQNLERNIATINNPSITRNTAPFVKRPNKKNKPVSYKESLKKKSVANNNSNNKTSFSQKLYNDYIKKGKITNSQKRFLNLISNQIVTRKECSSCSSAIKGLTL